MPASLLKVFEINNDTQFQGLPKNCLYNCHWCNTCPKVLGNQSASGDKQNFQNLSVWLPDWAINFLKSKF